MFYTFRPTQGGFSTRKFIWWIRSCRRYRVRLLIAWCLIIPIYRDVIFQPFYRFLNWAYWKIVFLCKPQVYRTYNYDVRSPHVWGVVTEEPPQEGIRRWSMDPKEKIENKANDFIISEFKETYKLDIFRTMGYITHPSRETNAVVEGALLQEHQNKIADSMMIKIAEECVRKGVWKDINEAFVEREKLRKKMRRKDLMEMEAVKI
ncbi:unnamed protein product [Blepharisma stoltei]|uniref:Uncharacterized protein n=1 Tax=Blepharisma stoltei TaxID=1481888 RepID=A0AAU9IZF3_9CILI|nr:unnamed protein product [Blepharisma stoltei]